MPRIVSQPYSSSEKTPRPSSGVRRTSSDVPWTLVVPEADTGALFCDDLVDKMSVSATHTPATAAITRPLSSTQDAVAQPSRRAGRDVYICLPRINSETCLTFAGVSPPRPASCFPRVGGSLTSPRHGGRADWTWDTSLGAFEEVLRDTSVLTVPPTPLPSCTWNNGSPHQWGRDDARATRQNGNAPSSSTLPIDLFYHLVHTSRVSRQARLPAPRAASPPASHLYISGCWELLCLPGALTDEAEVFLNTNIAPWLPATVAPRRRTGEYADPSSDDAEPCGDRRHGDGDEDETTFALGAAVAAARVGDEAGLHEGAAGQGIQPTPSIGSASRETRGGSVKRARSAPDTADQEDGEGSLASESALLDALRKRRALTFQTMSAHTARASMASVSARFGTAHGAGLTKRPRAGDSGSLHFTAEAHLLSARLPQVVMRHLLDALRSAMVPSPPHTRVRGVADAEDVEAAVPFWIACYAHTPAVHASVCTHVLDARNETRTDCRDNRRAMTRSVRWPCWVPSQACSVMILNALQAAAWVVVRHIILALDAESRVSALNTAEAVVGEPHARGEATQNVTDTESVKASPSAAVRALTHMLEAVLSSKPQTAVLAAFQTHLPFPVHKSDLLRYPPPPGVRTGPVLGAVVCPAAFSASPAARDTQSSPFPSGPVVFPSVLETVHDIALRLLARYFPSWSTQLQDVLWARMRCVVPDCRADGKGRVMRTTTMSAAASAPSLAYREIATCLAKTTHRLLPWRCFWERGHRAPARPCRGLGGGGTAHAQEDALRFSMTLSQWSIRTVAWLLSEPNDGACSDAQTLALFLAVLPPLCRVYLNTQEVQSVLEHSLQDLTKTDCTQVAERAFRFLLAVLISGTSSPPPSPPPQHARVLCQPGLPHSRGDAEQTADMANSDVQRRAGLCWAAWLVPLQHTLTAVEATPDAVARGEASVGLFTAVMGRLQRALRAVRAELHMLSTATAASGLKGAASASTEQSRELSDAAHNEEEGAVRHVGATSSVLFATTATAVSAASAASVCSGLTDTSAGFLADTAPHAQAQLSACPWGCFVHRCDVRRLRAVLQCVQHRVFTAAEVATAARAGDGVKDENNSELDMADESLSARTAENDQDDYFFTMPVQAQLCDASTAMLGSRSSSAHSPANTHSSYSSTEEETVSEFVERRAVGAVSGRC